MQKLGIDIEKKVGTISAYDHRHGGPYDRGSADSYYRRPYDPHYFTGSTYQSVRVGKAAMTQDEIDAYAQGYKDNEAAGDFKEW